MRKVRGYLLLSILTFWPFVAFAQALNVVRGDCTPPPVGDGVAETRGASRPARLTPMTHWDPSKTYRQMVVLVEFKGDSTYFSMEDPRTFYDNLFNTPGFHQREGKGCVADYFRDQSLGIFNLQCDVYGPYQLDRKAQPYDSPTSSTRNYGREAMAEATRLLIEQNPTVDFRQYDWDGNGSVEQVVYVFAGVGGNSGSNGYLWPNTSSFSTITTPDGVRISNYSASAECWSKTMLCGIGTICHEYTHSLGLPDIYPTSSSAGSFSMADEWDLMDGGNFTNYGWCPPNYTALERMLLGWLTPVELAEPTTIVDLKPVEDGGQAYIIRHTGTEYLLLENRQWSGWDAGLPGQGLVIYHVDYLSSAWTGNTVNNVKGHPRFDLVHADNKNYNDWDAIVPYDNNQWAAAGRMHNKHLSTSAYPWTEDEQVLDSLTDHSVPATVMYTKNAADTTLLSKPVTCIRVTNEGLASFDFMGGDPTGIRTVVSSPSGGIVCDLQGRRVVNPRRGLYIVGGKKIVIK
ncbi:MAG: M6 family metalloprotease domain-containing protein [Prevotella sp.]|nr:M6 family metalloprotease domain-containing protein [Prevotella sp.]